MGVNLCLILRENTLILFENRALRGIFGPQAEETRREPAKVYEKGFLRFYSTLDLQDNRIKNIRSCSTHGGDERYKEECILKIVCKQAGL
jgi:hypothetical protein